MEADPNSPNKTPKLDEDDDDLLGLSKKSKFSKSKDVEKADSDESAVNGKEAPAKYFSKEEANIPEDALKNREQKLEELTENLSEDEVSEAVLAIINSRNEDLGQELAQVETNSQEEFEALADAAFLESLQDRIEEGSDLSDELLDDAFNEAVEDLSLNQDSFDEEKPSVTTPAPSSTSSTFPPTPPIPPTLPPPSPSFPVPPGGHGSRAYTAPPHVPPTPSSPDSSIEYYERRRRGRDMLVGAILGYIIGRRGGRKRTEKKLFPKIDKLEKQVGQLNDTISEKERKIRELARRSVTSKEVIAVNTIALIERRKGRVDTKVRAKRREELEQIHTVDSLGKFTLPALEVFRERRILDGTENSPNRKPVEIMTVSELIEKLEHANVDGEKIVELFKAGQINERILRQLAKEFMRGGLYEQTLRRELLANPIEVEQKRTLLGNLHSKVVFENNASSMVPDKSNDTDSNHELIPKPRPVIFNNDENKKNTSTLIAVITAVAALIALLFLLKRD